MFHCKVCRRYHNHSGVKICTRYGIKIPYNNIYMSINYLADDTTDYFYCFFSHYFPKDIIHYIDTFRRIIDYKSYFSKTILLKWPTSKP